MIARRWVPFLAGLLFAVGLGISGMTDARKVIGFLDLFGRWDASLALVMAGAIAVHLPFLRLVPRSAIVDDDGCAVPSDHWFDRRTIIGSAIFGVGWGLAGYCPGPALVSLVTFRAPVLVFVAAMIVGAGLFAAWSTRSRALG
jgi:uncharacterized membrane protein YedE/YeeE